MTERFEIYRDVGGQYWLQLKGRNWEIVALASPTPTTAAAKRACRRFSEPRTVRKSWTSPKSKTAPSSWKSRFVSS